MNKKLIVLAFVTLFATIVFAEPTVADTVSQAAPATKSTGIYTQIIDWYNAHLNYWSIALLMAIESSFIPFPSELVVPPAAYKALQPDSGLSIVLIVIAASVGALVGAYINYFLAKFLGRPIIYKFADSRLGHFLLLDTGKVQKAEDYFREHGAVSTFVGRLITVIRQLISIPAGIANMKLSEIDPQSLAIGHDVLHRLLHQKALKEEFPGCRAYMEHISDKYNYIPTILQKESFRPFRAYYIPNKVMMKVRDPKRPFTYWYENVPITDISSLLKVSSYLVLSGSGGLGKSMMMRNILLTAIDEYDSEGRIPLFIPLKDYDKAYDSFTNYIFEMVSNLWPDLTMDGLETLLKSGKVLFLFDGLDEIHSSLLSTFTKQMNGFIDRYQMDSFIISSRPYTNFQSFTRFSVLDLQPFSKDQALEFVDRVNYHAEAPKLQARFRSLLNTTLYRTHNSFCGNPLLLSIMILTFELDADVPTVKHKFYQEAYIVLSRRHDALKDGYSRELKTGWKYDRFADYFAFFCTVTYRDGKVSFDYTDMEKYFKLLVKKYKLSDVTVDDFIYDLTNNLCLMYMDGMQYSFIHRSFQEYFCAKFFNSQLDEQLTKVIPVFDQDNTTKKGDTALQMLYDMKPKAVAFYMFLPYLDRLIESCEDGDGIWTFLDTIYPDYEMADGDCEADEDMCAPSSNLYAFILESYHLEIDVPFFDELEQYSYFIEETYVYREDIRQDDLDYNVPSSYEEIYGEPEVTGHIYKLDWDRINNNRGLYGKLAHAIESPDCAFVKEYEAIKRLRDDLREKAKPADDSDDFLDDME